MVGEAGSASGPAKPMQVRVESLFKFVCELRRRKPIML